MAPIPDAPPGQHTSLEATVSHATAQDLLVVCAELLHLALHVYHQTQASPAGYQVLRHLLAAKEEITNAQRWHRSLADD